MSGVTAGSTAAERAYIAAPVYTAAPAYTEGRSEAASHGDAYRRSGAVLRQTVACGGAEVDCAGMVGDDVVLVVVAIGVVAGAAADDVSFGGWERGPARRAHPESPPPTSRSPLSRGWVTRALDPGRGSAAGERAPRRRGVATDPWMPAGAAMTAGWERASGSCGSHGRA